jgi:DNA-binding SARP family transcriptional activator
MDVFRAAAPPRAEWREETVEFSIGSVAGTAARPLPVRQRTPHIDRPSIRGRLLSDVFEVLPTGILVVGDHGAVLAWNPALAEIAGERIDHARTCCEIFGCGAADSPLADVCLTELALARGEPLSDLVVELPGDPGANVQITATPLARLDGRTVVFEIRTAGRRTEARPIPRRADVIHIRTLGETVVTTPDGEIRGGWLDHRAGRLLKFLVTHRYNPIHADAIAEALWPRARADTTNTVRHFVHTLREKLEPGRGRYERSAFVLARNGGYALNPDRVVVDADDFEREAKAGLIALAGNERQAAVERMRRALELYRGDFLAEERFDDWAIAERERLRELAAKPLRALASLTHDPDEAAYYLERLADMEPLDVDIHEQLISTWLQLGRRSRAIRHYRALQSRLMRELGERVTFDLAEMVRTPPIS